MEQELLRRVIELNTLQAKQNALIIGLLSMQTSILSEIMSDRTIGHEMRNMAITMAEQNTALVKEYNLD